MSVQVGVWERLLSDVPASWTSDNENVFVDQQGWVIPLRNVTRPASMATITATAGSSTAVCKITIVNWPANELVLEPVSYLPLSTGLVRLADGYIYGARELDTVNKMFRTLDMDSLEVLSTLPHLPNRMPILVATAAGTFFRTGGTVFRSLDLSTWMTADSASMDGLNNQFGYSTAAGTTRVYVGEYSTPGPGESTPHQVRRGTYPPSGSPVWEEVLGFYSRTEHASNPALTPFCWHIHVTQVDPFTGHVYVGTGDTDEESSIRVSKDHGATWAVLGMGSQDWRTLSMWFTANFVYWNMDTGDTQHVWRLARTDLDNQSPSNDLKELVCTLDSGSHWYITWAQDDRGDDIIIMGAAVEGALRDLRARVYYLKELSTGAVEYGELYALEWSDDVTYRPFMQLEPYVQDSAGFVYFRGRDTAAHDGEIWRMRLVRTPRVPRLTFRSAYTFRQTFWP